LEKQDKELEKQDKELENLETQFCQWQKRLKSFMDSTINQTELSEEQKKEKQALQREQERLVKEGRRLNIEPEFTPEGWLM